MALIDWTDSLSVRISKIDEQHKTLVGMINELHAAMTAGKSATVLGGIIDKMVEYAASHFATEEALFAKHDYLQAFTHKSEHTKFVKKVVEFQTGFKSGKSLLTLDVMNFLKDWLTSHIAGSDQKYAPFLIGKGVT